MQLTICWSNLTFAILALSVSFASTILVSIVTCATKKLKFCSGNITYEHDRLGEQNTFSLVSTYLDEGKKNKQKTGRSIFMLPIGFGFYVVYQK